MKLLYFLIKKKYMIRLPLKYFCTGDTTWRSQIVGVYKNKFKELPFLVGYPQNFFHNAWRLIVEPTCAHTWYSSCPYHFSPCTGSFIHITDITHNLPRDRFLSLIRKGLWYHGNLFYQPNSGLAGINKLNKLGKPDTLETGYPPPPHIS